MYFYSCFAVSALLEIRRHLKDPLENLWNWKRKTDPCISNWNGVICTVNRTDGYQHVQELYVFELWFYCFIFLPCLYIINTAGVCSAIIFLELWLLSLEIYLKCQFCEFLCTYKIFFNYISILIYDFYLRDFMWNNISGSIPKEIGKITALVHLYVFYMNFHCLA